LAAILVIGTLYFRSLLAGALLVLTALIANGLSFAYMNYNVMGLTVDTIPVISLGIGLGLSFAIYVLARACTEAQTGLPTPDALRVALRTSGRTVFASFIVIVGGLLPWVYSPMLFQNEMSLMLFMLMTTNLVAGALILPALVAWLRPRFMSRAAEDTPAMAAAN